MHIKICHKFDKLGGGSRGLVVKGGDSQSEGCEFKSNFK